MDCQGILLALFCVIMGRFSGKLAPNLGAFGGMYIASSILLRFMEFFKTSSFRAAFEDKRIF